MKWSKMHAHTETRSWKSVVAYFVALYYTLYYSLLLFLLLPIYKVYVCVGNMNVECRECGVRSASLVVYIFIQFKNLCSSFLIISVHPSIHSFIHLIFTIVCCLRICWRWKREILYHTLVLKHLFYKPTLSWLPSSLLNPSTSISI